MFKLFGDSDYHDTPSPSSKPEVTGEGVVCQPSTPNPIAQISPPNRVPNSPTGQVLEAGPGWPVLVMAMTGPD